MCKCIKREEEYLKIKTHVFYEGVGCFPFQYNNEFIFMHILKPYFVISFFPLSGLNNIETFKVKVYILDMGKLGASKDSLC